MIRALLVFASAFVADWVWIAYMAAAARNVAAIAAWWSAALIALASFNVLAYVHSAWYLVPSLLGAWLGTYLAIRIKERSP